MINFILNAIKIIILLGTLVFTHELGHFLVAKLFKIKVNEFAIGFGPVIFSKQYKATKYALRLIPLGGFINMEGEEERSTKEGSFSEASILKRICIVAAGGVVNILLALIVYLGLVWYYNNIQIAFMASKDFFISIYISLKELVTGQVTSEQLMGIVGVSDVIVKTTNLTSFLSIFSMISLSIGVTNLLPIPPLDGGKMLLLIIEGIRRKPLSESIELKIQMAGFIAMILLAIFITYNDIIKIFVNT